MKRELLFTMTFGNKTPSGNLNIPKYLKERFSKLEYDDGLDPEMGKYILYFNEGWGYPMGAEEYWNSIPVMNKKEAIEFLKEAERIEKEVK